MSDHTVVAFDRELDELGRRITEMGDVASQMVGDAVNALSNGDSGLAQSVIESDPRLDSLQRDVEQQAILTIARRQPVARDLREVLGAVQIAKDLERIGDLAKNIAWRATTIDRRMRPLHTTVRLQQMSNVAEEMLIDILDGYARRDAMRSKMVWLRDTELDSMEDLICRDLVTQMTENPRIITACAHLLFCSKNIEGIGNHASSIAERVHYLVTGSAIDVVQPEPH
jgi:phosphate transport system protein